MFKIVQIAGDKRKGKEIAVEPRKKSKAKKEADRARAIAVVDERRTRRPDPPFQIRDPTPQGQEPLEEPAEQAGALVPEAKQPAGLRRSDRVRTQQQPALAATSETSVRQGPRTRGGGPPVSPLRVGPGHSARRSRS